MTSRVIADGFCICYMLNVNPYPVLFSADFNGHCQTWWPQGDSNSEGDAIYDITSNLGLTQLISEPTNFQDNCAPSCIDLIFCDQPNVVTQSGTHPSLHPRCKYQLVYCKSNYLIPQLPRMLGKRGITQKQISTSLKGIPLNFHGKMGILIGRLKSSILFFST